MLGSWRKLAVGLALALPFLLAVPEIEARGSRGRSSWGSSSRRSSWGSSRRSSPSRSSSWKRSKKSTNKWGSSSSKKSSSKKNWGSSSSSGKSKSKFVTAPKGSPQHKKWSTADKKLASKAKSNGTSYKSRSQATSAFKSKNTSKYTAKYGTKPSSRPSHIPKAYKGKSGNTYNVTYNQSHGGYGYMGPSGSWMMYNAMADVAMVSLLMQRSNYYYPGIHPQPVVSNPHYVQASANGMSVGAIIGIVFLVFLLFLASGIIVSQLE